MHILLALAGMLALLTIAAPAQARPSNAPILENLYGYVINTDAGTFDGAALAAAVAVHVEATAESLDVQALATAAKAE